MDEDLPAYPWPWLDEKQIEIIQPFDWWDGPLSGLAKYQDQEYWFEFQHEEEIEGHTSQYHYLLYKLTEEQMQKVKTAIQTALEKGKPCRYGVEREWDSLKLTGAVVVGRFKSGGNADLYGIKVK